MWLITLVYTAALQFWIISRRSRWVISRTQNKVLQSSFAFTWALPLRYDKLLSHPPRLLQPYLRPLISRESFPSSKQRDAAVPAKTNRVRANSRTFVLRRFRYNTDFLTHFNTPQHSVFFVIPTKIVALLRSQVPMAFAGGADRRTRDIRRWSWRRNSTRTITWRGGDA